MKLPDRRIAHPVIVGNQALGDKVAIWRGAVAVVLASYRTEQCQLYVRRVLLSHKGVSIQRVALEGVHTRLDRTSNDVAVGAGSRPCRKLEYHKGRR